MLSPAVINVDSLVAVLTDKRVTDALSHVITPLIQSAVSAAIVDITTEMDEQFLVIAEIITKVTVPYPHLRKIRRTGWIRVIFRIWFYGSGWCLGLG